MRACLIYNGTTRMDAPAALAFLKDLNENDSDGGEEMDHDISDHYSDAERLSISWKGSISGSR